MHGCTLWPLFTPPVSVALDAIMRTSLDPARLGFLCCCVALRKLYMNREAGCYFGSRRLALSYLIRDLRDFSSKSRHYSKPDKRFKSLHYL